MLSMAGCSALVQTVKNQECALDPARPFDVVEVNLAQHELRLFWRDADGEPFLTLDAVRRHVEERGDSLVAATNAGIYEPGFVPTGLYVEMGRALHPLNLEDGEGNFYLKPNGVFLVAAAEARIVEASEFADINQSAQYATQSGPLLLFNGTIHPAFTPGSENCRLRNGIGVAPGNRVFLAISNGAVNFHDFAEFFRDELGATDALYLDGGISDLYAPAEGRTATNGQQYAGILAVIAKQRQ